VSLVTEPVLVVLPPGIVALIEAEAARREIGSADALAAILAATAPEALAEAARSVLLQDNDPKPELGVVCESVTTTSSLPVILPQRAIARNDHRGDR